MTAFATASDQNAHDRDDAADGSGFDSETNWDAPPLADETGPAGQPDPQPAAAARAQPRRPAPKAARPAASRAGGASAAVRRAATKALEIESAPDAHRALLAQLLNVRDDTVDLTVAVVSGAPDVAAKDMYAIADSDPIDAGATAYSVVEDKERAKALWSLLLALGAVEGNQPGVPVEAARTIARAAQGLKPEARSTLDAALALAS